MKILIISNFFYPQNSPRAFRTTELAKEFSNLGHKVTVYTTLSDYNYNDFLSQYNNITLKNSVLLKENGISIIGGKFDYLVNKFLEIFLHYPFILLWQKLSSILKDESNFDLLISIAFPHPIHWGVSRALKRNPQLAKKWIADCGDPFMKNDGKGFGKKMFYFKYFEKNWCKKCDIITVPYEQQRSKYYSEFADKIKIVPQGFNLSSIKLSDKDIKNAIPTFIFAGTFYLKHRNPTLFLEYLSNLDIDFKFIVYTNRSDIVMPFKSKLGEKLQVHGYIPRQELIYQMSKVDFLVNIENGNETNERPSKLIDYALSKRPVLSVNSFKLNEGNIIKFFNKDYSGQLAMEDIKKYDIKNVSKAFLNFCR